MREWWTARELAAAGLPDLPATESGTIRRATREAWQCRERQGRGGGIEYHINSLPAPAIAALHRRATRSQKVTPARPSADWATFHQMPASIQMEADRRFKAVLAIEKIVERGTSRVAAIDAVAGQFETTRASIYRWLKTIRNLDRGDWMPALAPAWSRDAASTPVAECTPEAWEAYKADWLRPAKPAAMACYRRLQAVAAERGWTVPSLKTLQRRVDAEVPEKVQVLRREGRDALERMFPAQQRGKEHLEVLEAVCADGHKLDVQAVWPDGTTGRPVIVGWQDIRSSKMLSWRIGPDETSELVRLSFADLVERWGVPDKAYLDNGRTFAAKGITGGQKTRYRFKIRAEEPEGLLTALGTRVHWTTPYHGQAKPIERYWRDLAEYVARHPICHGAYVGRNTAEKPHDYGSRTVPIDKIEALVAQEIARLNAWADRRGGAVSGRAFDEVFAEGYESRPIRRATAEQCRKLLLAVDSVSARRPDGAIVLMDNVYWSEALSDAEVAGRKVAVRFDPAHLESPIHVYRLDGRYIGSAGRVEKAGFDDASKAKAHTRDRRAFRKAVQEQDAAINRMTARELAELHGATTPPAPAAAKRSVIKLHRQTGRRIGPEITGPAQVIDVDDAMRKGLAAIKRQRAANEAG